MSNIKATYTVRHPITGRRIRVDVGNDEPRRRGGKEFEDAYSNIKRGTRWPNPSAEGLVLLDRAIELLEELKYDDEGELQDVVDLLTDYREGISNG